jgi:hypothetical protein
VVKNLKLQDYGRKVINNLILRNTVIMLTYKQIRKYNSIQHTGIYIVNNNMIGKISIGKGSALVELKLAVLRNSSYTIR